MRSVAAVVAGLMVMMIGVMIGTAAATAVFVPGGLSAAMDKSQAPTALPAGYLATNLVGSLAAALLGGWTTARLAPRARDRHALVLAGLIVVLAIPSALNAASMGQPRWYGWVIALVGVAGVLAGSRLRRS